MSQTRILYIADTESQLRPAFLLAQSIQQQTGGVIVGNLVPTKKQISLRQVKSAQVDGPLLGLSLPALLQERIDEFDVIVTMLTGSQLFGIRRALEMRQRLAVVPRRPLLVTGYNGLIYEKHVEGLLWRIGYDVICVNSRADMRRFTQVLNQLDMPVDSLVYGGAPLIRQRLESSPRTLPPADAPVRSILFATQAVAPGRLQDRVHLTACLREYALVHPERRVLIKPRTRPDETTFHVERNHFEAVYQRAFGRVRPPNLHFAYGSFGQYLEEVDLVVAVSSTAVIEALAAGVRAAVVTDVGVAETLGNHFFLGSGLMCSMNDLIVDRVPQLNPAWALDNGIDPDVHSSALGKRVSQLLEAHPAEAASLAWTPCFYNAERSAAIDDAWLSSPLNPGWRPSRGVRLNDEPAQVARPRGRKLRKLYENPRRFFVDFVKKRLPVQDFPPVRHSAPSENAESTQDSAERSEQGAQER